MADLPTIRARRHDVSAVAFALAFPTLVTVVYFILLAERSSAWQQGAFGVGKVLQFAFPVLWVRFAQRRKVTLRRPRLRESLEGAALGLAIVAAMSVLYVAWLKPGGLTPETIAAIRAKLAGMDVASPARFASLGAFYAIVHSLLEEYYWRWFAYGQLRELTGRRGAIGISSAGFMAHHVCVLGHFFGWSAPAEIALTAFLSLSVAVGGVLWGALYERHGSLYGVWISHMLVDAGIFAIGYDLALR